MSIEIRTTAEHELRRAADVVSTALLGPIPTDDVWKERSPGWTEMPSVTAWDGTCCVGHAGQFPVETVAPGGARPPTAAVTRVAVLPTHRRRGIATGLMERLIADSVRQGHSLMSLRASETAIYGRYGFGLAGDSANLDIDVVRAGPLRGVDRTGSFELLHPDDALARIPPIYDAVALRRPGTITRPGPTWWRRQFDALLERKKASYVAVHLDDAGTADGYVQYAPTWNDDEPDEAPTGRGDVEELFGADDNVELALWQYLLDIDLVTRWRANGRPLDDPVRDAARDQRAVRTRAIEDEQWIRLIDVDVALSSRTYRPVDGAVVVEVADPLVDANNRSWRISADGAEPTDRAADLSVSAATLSALWMGGRSWERLAALGEVSVRDQAALATADSLFSIVGVPFCGTFF